MKTILRRLRGAVVIGLTWGAGWAVLGLVLGLMNDQTIATTAPLGALSAAATIAIARWAARREPTVNPEAKTA